MKTLSHSMKILFSLILFLLISCDLSAQSSNDNYSKEIIVVNYKGAKFSEGEEINFDKFDNANTFIQIDNKMNVLNVRSKRAKGKAKDKVQSEFLLVEYNGKKGWIKAEDTNYYAK